MEIIVALFSSVMGPVLLLGLAWMTGSYLERRHFARIRRREEACAHRPVITSEEWDDRYPLRRVELAQGAVVVSIDYFKRILAALYNITGGRVRVYESILDRARREAVLRMKESCPQADIFVNLRLETCILVNTGRRKQHVSGAEILAYATALYYRKDALP